MPITVITEEQRKTLRKKWVEANKNIISGVPKELPPMREISHEILLIDENKQYHYHLPRCPDGLKPQLLEKINKCIDAKW